MESEMGYRAPHPGPDGADEPFFDTKETNISYPHAFVERLMELISKKEPDVIGKG